MSSASVVLVTVQLIVAFTASLFATAVATDIEAGSNIQSAIDTASPGDTILVSPGVYNRIDVTKSLTLVGNGAVIKAGAQEACIAVKANYVNISGFTVQDGLYGILLNEVSGCNISYNQVFSCKQPGIALLYSNGNEIYKNNASFNGLGGEGWYGIYLSNSDDNLIIDNVAINNGAYGIDLFPACNNNTIRGNVLERNMYGLYMFTNCSDNVIENNVMSRNTNSGLDMRFNCHDNQVINNTIEDNVVVGISLMDSGHNFLKGNTIYGNSRFGIQLQGSSNNNEIIGNAISQSSTGVYIESGSNQVYGNNLKDNVAQSVDRGDSNIWNTEYPKGGNTWGDYTGEDKFSGLNQDMPGSDGIGDTPYVIDADSKDAYPVMGERYIPLKVAKVSINPSTATVGDEIVIMAWIDSINGLSQVVVRVPNALASGYVRMVNVGDHYEGSLATALMDPGSYQLNLSATDKRGYELEEKIGEFILNPRQGRDFQAAMSQLKG